MKKGLFLLFVLLVFGSSECFSQSDRWVYVTETNPEIIYYDSKTIKYENDCVTFFTKIQFKERVYDESNGKYKDYLIQKQKIYCIEYKIKYLSTIEYYTDGISENFIINVVDDIIPDSIGETLFLSVCR